MTIGERIKERRIELGYSQDELAKKCGYKSRSSINKIELSRDLPLNKVNLMANALDTTPSYLLGWDAPETKGTPQPKEEPNQENYYLNEEAAELAEFLFNNPDYQVLFDASRKVKPEDIKKALKAIGIFID